MTLDLTLPSEELTRLICDIESVSGNEAKLADAIEVALREYAHLEVIRHGNTVIARTMQGRAQRVVIAGHIDTVPINKNLPTRLETENGVEYLWGRGTVDMKAGAAIHLKLAAEFTETPVDITWIWYENEEVSSDLNGLTILTAERPELLQADFAILGEPTSAMIEGGCQGTLLVTVRTHGERAHSARSWVGKNAIHGAAGILSRLEAYQPQRKIVDGLEYREGMNAVAIRGGVAGNVVPDLCEVEVNYRFAPDTTPEQAADHVREVFVGFEVELTDAAPGARPGLDAPVVKHFLAAVDTEVRPKFGWTDVARFGALGIPAINYGPGDPNLAHHDQERVPLEQIAQVERGMRAWLANP
jgi:succinyl-diaminopimelate desuccinylase